MRKSGKCVTRRMTFSEAQRYSNPVNYGRKWNPAWGEFDRDKFVDFNGWIEEKKELEKEYRNERKAVVNNKMGVG